MALRTAPAAVFLAPIATMAAVHIVAEMPEIPAGNFPAFGAQAQFAESARALEDGESEGCDVFPLSARFAAAANSTEPRENTTGA